MPVKTYGVRPTKDEDVTFQLIKAQLEKEGWGAVNRFFREAILEKWELEHPESVRDRKKRIGRPGRRVADGRTFHVDAPIQLKEYIERVIKSGEAANSGDALVYLAKLAHGARFLHHLYIDDFIEKYATPALNTNGDMDAKRTFCEKYGIPFKDWQDFILFSVGAMKQRITEQSRPSLDRFTR